MLYTRLSKYVIVDEIGVLYTRLSKYVIVDEIGVLYTRLSKYVMLFYHQNWVKYVILENKDAMLC